MDPVVLWAGGSALPVERELAPPVLTTTPSGAWEVVDPVEADLRLDGDVDSVTEAALSSDESVGPGVELSGDCDDASDDGVSAHATPFP